MCLARITYLTGKEWHSTSTIFNQYCKTKGKDTKELSYRRVSEILKEVENTGLAISQTSSKGRRGYGTQYKLETSPETIGMNCFPKYWRSMVKAKEANDNAERQRELGVFSKDSLVRTFQKSYQMGWERYVGDD